MTGSPVDACFDPVNVARLAQGRSKPLSPFGAAERGRRASWSGGRPRAGRAPVVLRRPDRGGGASRAVARRRPAGATSAVRRARCRRGRRAGTGACGSVRWPGVLCRPGGIAGPPRVLLPGPVDVRHRPVPASRQGSRSGVATSGRAPAGSGLRRGGGCAGLRGRVRPGAGHRHRGAVPALRPGERGGERRDTCPVRIFGRVLRCGRHLRPDHGEHTVCVGSGRAGRAAHLRKRRRRVRIAATAADDHRRPGPATPGRDDACRAHRPGTGR